VADPIKYIYSDQGDKLSQYSHVRPSVGPFIRPCEQRDLRDGKT